MKIPSRIQDNGDPQSEPGRYTFLISFLIAGRDPVITERRQERGERSDEVTGPVSHCSTALTTLTVNYNGTTSTRRDPTSSIIDSTANCELNCILT